jgi:hypothetical protein
MYVQTESPADQQGSRPPPESEKSLGLLRRFSLGLNVMYLLLAIAGTVISARATPYWQCLLLALLALLGIAALLKPAQQILYWTTFVLCTAFGLLGVCAVLYVVVVAKPYLLSSNPIFVFAASFMVLVPGATAIALVHTRICLRRESRE